MLDERLISLDSAVKKITGDDSEQEILGAIHKRVTEMLDKNPDLLMSYLYRLDVLEVDLKRILHFSNTQPIADSITELIWERQKARVETKKQYKQTPIKGWEF